MKREIIFRGKRVDNGEWIEGCIINNLWTKVNSGESVIEIVTGHPDIDCYGDLEFSGCFEVHEETVGMFTNLNDKNGINIYEGDVLRNPAKETGIVIWGESGFVLDIRRKNGSKWYMPLSIGFVKNKEIIGNIHSNPELLK